MDIHELVEQAVENAPIVDGFVATMNNLSEYTDEDDDHTVHLNPKARADYANEVSVDAELPSGLRNLYRAFVDVTGFEFDSTMIDDVERHEGQHLTAAAHLGATAARFGIIIHKVQPYEGSEAMPTILFYHAAQNLRTTKLGAALIAAHPLKLSEGDRIDVRNYGYSGIDELAELAMRRNGARKDPATEQFYPVPLSSSGTSTGNSRFGRRDY